MRLMKMIPIGAMVIALLPAPASADWLFTPYVGGLFGGAANFSDFDDPDDEAEKRMTFGGQLGYMGAGIFGVEVDFGWTPNFFEDTVGPGNFEFGDSNVTTLMGNIILGAPIGGQSGLGIRPYATAGVGMIRTQIDASSFFDEVSTNDFGVNVGGGVMGFLSDNVGIRGDLRYFRSLQDNEPGDGDLDVDLGGFDFWRGTVGVTFRW
jgi:opacity protein-like surface antigen